jgi:hypothetical protein
VGVQKDKLRFTQCLSLCDFLLRSNDAAVEVSVQLNGQEVGVHVRPACRTDLQIVLVYVEEGARGAPPVPVISLVASAGRRVKLLATHLTRHCKFSPKNDAIFFKFVCKIHLLMMQFTSAGVSNDTRCRPYWQQIDAASA